MMVRSLRRLALALLGGAALTGGLAGCAPAPPPAAAPTEIGINAADLSLTAPEKLSAGWARFTVKNDGPAPGGATLVRLKDGVTLDALQEAVKQGFEPAMQLVTMQGGPMAGPGQSAAVLVNLQPGQYALVGRQGVVRPLSVQAASGAAAPAPAVDATVTLRDFSFDVPETLPSGRRTFQVPNVGQQPHELIIGRLAEGKSAADLLAYASQPPSGPPPLLPVAGVAGIPPGGAALLSVDLAPGTYYAVCFIPDPASHKSHLALGMVREFTVR